MGFRKSFVHLTIKRIIVLLFVCFAGQSFAIIDPANDARSYTNRRYLKLPMNTPESFSIEMEIEGVTRKVHLNRHSLHGPNYQVRGWKNGQYHDVHSTNIETYRGYLQDDPESKIAATLGPDGLDARIIESNGRIWDVKPTRGQKRAARQTDIAHTIDEDIEGFTAENCGVGMYTDDIYESPYPQDVFADTSTGYAQPVLARGMESVEDAPLIATHSTGSCHLHRAEISFDCEVNFFNDYGSVAATEARVNQIFNYIDLVYAQEVLITYELVEIVVRQTPFYSEPRGDGALLNEFRAEWNTNTPGTYQARDLTHLMIGSGKTWDADCGCIAGLAWVGVVCTSSAYGWSRDSDAIVAHEIGHNWGGGHCEDGSSCNILCSGCPVVTPNLQRTIEGHRDSRNCLDIVPGGFATQVPPHATQDSVSISLNDLLVQETITFDVLANDYDANCDSIALDNFDSTSARGGAISLSTGTGPDARDQLIYTPPSTVFIGQDTFSYTICDGTDQDTEAAFIEVLASDNQLFAYWKLDETSGTTSGDATGNGYDGTLVGDPVWATGQINGGLQFNSGQWVDINAGEYQAFPWTAAMWVRRTANTTSAALLQSSSHSLRLEQWPNTNKVGITRSGVADYTYNYTMPLNTWTHLTFVGTDTETRLYVNGQFQETLAQTIRLPMDTLSSSGDPLAAVLDDVRLYDIELSVSEIQLLYDNAFLNGPSFNNDPIGKPDAVEDMVYSGQSLSGDASDPDAGDTLTFSKVSGPDWLDVAANGDLTGTPDDSHVGVNSFGVRVTDTGGFSDDATLNITVYDLYDGSWGLSDFAGFSAQWNTYDCGICAGADINGDNNVDMDDLVIHTERWLSGLSCTSETVHIDSVTAGTAAGTAGRKKLAATVIVHDNCGNPVEGVTVTGTFTDVFTEQTSFITDVHGVAFLVTNGQLSNPSFNFCVDDLAHPSMIYASEDNIDTCDDY